MWISLIVVASSVFSFFCTSALQESILQQRSIIAADQQVCVPCVCDGEWLAAGRCRGGNKRITSSIEAAAAAASSGAFQRE